MMIRIGDYEFSVRRETTGWAQEEENHVWEYIFRIEWLSPFEKQHREWVKEVHEKEKV